MSKRHVSIVSRASLAAIEVLENRRLLSSVSLVPNGDGTNELKIVGTNGNENEYIFDDPANNSIEVVDDHNRNNVADSGEVHSFSNANISIIFADMKKGNDKVEIHGISTYVKQDRSIEVDLGDGDDKFLFTTDPARDVSLGLPADSLGGDITDNSDFNFDVHGDAGKDTLTLDLTRTSIENSEVTAQMDASGGDDVVNVNLPDVDFEEVIGTPTAMKDDAIIDTGTENIASVLQIDIDLGGGNDTLNQHVNTLIFNDSTVTINVIGGSGNDKYNDYEDFNVVRGSSITVNADLGTGNDSYSGDFNFNSIPAPVRPVAAEIGPILGAGINIDQTSAANFILHGDDGNDKLQIGPADEVIDVGGTNITNSQIRGLMNVQLYGGDGNDTTAINLFPGPGVNVGITGIFRAVTAGENGNDKVSIDVLAGGEGGTWDLTETGGIGKDSLGAGFFDDSTLGVSYGPRAGILVDGGADTDKYDTEGNGIFKLRSVETLDTSLVPPFI